MEPQLWFQIQEGLCSFRGQFPPLRWSRLRWETWIPEWINVMVCGSQSWVLYGVDLINNSISLSTGTACGCKGGVSARKMSFQFWRCCTFNYVYWKVCSREPHRKVWLGCPRNKDISRDVVRSLLQTAICVFRGRNLSLFMCSAIFPQDMHCFENRRKPQQLWGI